MGDSPDINYHAPESTNSILKAYADNLPALIQATSSQILPTEQAILAANQAVQPGYTQSQIDLLKQFGPDMQSIMDQLSAQSLMSQLGRETEAVQGPGKDLALATQEAAKLVDPEYYKTREVAAKSLQDLLGSYDPTKLSGSEMANVERGLNRTNAGQIPTSTTAISNAMAFDDRLQNKRTALANALSIVPSNLAGMKSGQDVAYQATGRASSAPTQGSNLLGYSSPNVGAMTQSLGQNLLNSATQMGQSRNQYASQAQSDYAKTYKSTLDNVSQGMGMVSGFMGGGKTY
jgi:hypothetical protein